MVKIEGIDYDEQLTRIKEATAERQEEYVKEYADTRRTE